METGIQELHKIEPWPSDLSQLMLANSGNLKAGKDFTEKIHEWTLYANYLAIADGSLLLTRDVAMHKIEDASMRLKVWKMSRAMHDDLLGVQQAFIKGINEMKAGKEPEFDFGISIIDKSKWPETPPAELGNTYFEDAWLIIKPGLDIVAQKSNLKPEVKAVISGLIKEGDEFVADLSAAGFFKKKNG